MEHVLIIGASRLAWFFSKMVEELAPGGYQIVAILDESRKIAASVAQRLSDHRRARPIWRRSSPTTRCTACAIDKVVAGRATARSDGRPLGRGLPRLRTLNIDLEVLPERLMSSDVRQ